MTLQLLISTIDQGIERAAQLILPPTAGIGYVVSWQHSTPADHHQLPVSLMREDIMVVHLEGRGLSRNRNHCLRHATADICLICDDDCRYSLDGLHAVVDTFERHRDTDVAAFMMRSSHCRKPYPSSACDLRHTPAGYYPTSFELAFRLSSVRDRLQFNEHFGLGTPLFHCCEEEIFVHDALKLGLTCRFYPLTIVEHDHPTTDSSRATTAGVLMGKGAYLYIGYRSKMLLYPFPIAWRLHKQHGVSFGYGLRHLFKGLLHMITHRSMATAGLCSTS